MSTVAAILKHKGYQVVTVDPFMRAGDIARMMDQHANGAVLVMDDTEHMLGIISERDFVRGMAAFGPLLMDMSAVQLMTRGVQVVHLDTTVTEAMRIMTQGRLRHLPVVDHDTLVGLISIGDVVKARIMGQDAVVESLTAYVSGSG